MSAQKVELGAPYGGAEGKLPSSLTGVLGAVAGFAMKVAAGYIRYRSFRIAEKELHALDDRMLSDIGISRSEITSKLINAANERRNGWRV
jgi:uncharacterized protein YjiS (DUF1127 family)